YEEDQVRRAGRLDIRPVSGQLRGGGASWQSLQRATGSIETDDLNGEISLLGRLHAVATPVNDLLRDLAGDLARRRVPPGSMDVEEVLARLPQSVRTGDGPGRT